MQDFFMLLAEIFDHAGDKWVGAQPVHLIGAVNALPKPKRPLLTAYRQEEVRCLRVLCDYLHLLEKRKMQCAPKTPEDDLDYRFVEACQMLGYVEYLADLLIAAKLEQQIRIVEMLNKDGLTASFGGAAGKTKEGGNTQQSA